MRLKLFRAAGMAEAMAQVRADLGADALILNTGRSPAASKSPPRWNRSTEPRPQTDPGRARRPDLARRAAVSSHPALAHGDLETAIAAALRSGDLPLAPHAPPVMLDRSAGRGQRP